MSIFRVIGRCTFPIVEIIIILLLLNGSVDLWCCHDIRELPVSACFLFQASQTRIYHSSIHLLTPTSARCHWCFCTWFWSSKKYGTSLKATAMRSNGLLCVWIEFFFRMITFTDQDFFRQATRPWGTANYAYDANAEVQSVGLLIWISAT